MAELSTPRKVEVTRLLPFPRSVVYEAWLDPVAMVSWISPEGSASVELDARVGGGFRILMHTEGEPIEHTGVYRELEPPSRLVFTWHSPYTGPEGSLVTIVLAEMEGATELRLTHELLPDEVVDPHASGWSRILLNLERNLATREERVR